MNKLQIIWVDNDIVKKAYLKLGDNVIGRNVEVPRGDGQVIQHAVVINLSPDGEMTMTPYQTSSCYIKSCGSRKWQLLELESTVSIKPGDVCSLLHDKFWFKILPDINVMEEKDNLKRKKIDDLDYDRINNKRKIEITVDDTSRECGDDNNIVSKLDYNAADKGSSIQTSTQSIIRRVGSISFLNEENAENSQAENKENDIHVVNNDSESQIKDLTVKYGYIFSTHEVEEYDDKYEHVFSGQNESLTEDQQSPQLHVPKESDQAPTASRTNIQVPKRNKSAYGNKCYRKNPDNNHQISHPGDTDYDAPSNGPESPHGVQSYHKNPQHKVKCKHTALHTLCTCKNNVRTMPQDNTSDTISYTEYSSGEESINISEYNSSDTDSSNHFVSDLDESECEWNEQSS